MTTRKPSSNHCECLKQVLGCIIEISSSPSLFTIPFHFLAAVLWTKYIGVNLFSRWVVNHYPSKKVQDVKHTWDYIWDQAAQLVEIKKAAADKPGELAGKDLLSVLGEQCRMSDTKTEADEIAQSTSTRRPEEQINSRTRRSSQRSSKLVT